MQITAVFFASTRNAVGQRALPVQLPTGATVEALLQALVADYPALARSVPTLMVAVNSEYTERTATLSDGDEVALIPPVSGGCDVEL